MVELKKLLQGRGASVGVARGRIFKVRNEADIDRTPDGCIIVSCFCGPELVSVYRKVAAVITDYGGTTCHAAVVARELGIPCIVGTKNGTDILKQGVEVIVDGEAGTVFLISETNSET